MSNTVDNIVSSESEYGSDYESDVEEVSLPPAPVFETTVVVPIGNATSDANRIVEPAHHFNKIILNLMIKNESKIIERCIQNSIDYVDAVNILDTGSTDHTVEVCKAYLTASGKPFRISVHPFKTFGNNRSISFDESQNLC